MKTEKQQSAVEFAVGQLEKFIPKGNQIAIYAILEQAKEMELDQRKNDYRAGWNDNKHKDWNCEFYLEKHLTNFETFKSE